MIELMKDELGEKIMAEFSALRPKTLSYLKDKNDKKDKKAKGTKMCVIKKELKFEACKHCLEANQLENKINQLEKKL